jgi:hypothetical protein
MDEANEELSIESTVITERIAVKEEAIHELVEGNMSLASVMERFRELNDGSNELQTALEYRYPGLDEDERLYRNIVDFVCVDAKDRADFRAVQARLAYEWQQLRERRTQAN